MHRFDQRQGFLVSALLHLSILMILVSHPPTPRAPDEIDPRTIERRDVVLVPPELLRQLAPTPPPGARPRPVPVPAPTPLPTPRPQAKDRISVGPPSDLRAKGPMILRREDDLTQVPRGERTAPPVPAPPTPAPAPPRAAESGGGATAVPGRPGLRLPPGLVGPPAPRGDEGRAARPGAIGPSIADAVDGVTRRVDRDARLGLPTGTGQNLGGLYFDPQGADFTLWVNTFKNEVYRNWIPPESFRLGMARGHVDFEFVVERNGAMTGLRMLKSSGTNALDRAAQYALTSSRFLPLPDDYGPPRITMQVTFYYGEEPRGS